MRGVSLQGIRSLLGYFVDLFSCHKCIKMSRLKFSQILLRESSVQLYGVEIIDYEEEQAKQNVVLVVELIRKCFSPGLIPCDLEHALHLLLDDPLHNLRAAKDDSSLLLPKERRELLVHLHTEYMTNVNPNLCAGDDGQEQLQFFFCECPYLDTWVDIMGRNKYLTDVANYNGLLGTLKRKKREVEEKKKRLKEENNEKEGEERKKGAKENKEKEEEDGRDEKEEEDGREEKEKKEEDGNEGEKGELQFHVMRNCDVNIPESAVKVKIISLRSFYYSF